MSEHRCRRSSRRCNEASSNADSTSLAYFQENIFCRECERAVAYVCKLVTNIGYLQIFWPRYSPQWFREDNSARNGSREKKPRKANTKMGERQHRYIRVRLVRWQQQAEWRRTAINFEETSAWQRRPDEDMLREEYDLTFLT